MNVFKTMIAGASFLLTGPALAKSNTGAGASLRSAYGSQTACFSLSDYFPMEALDRELHTGDTF